MSVDESMATPCSENALFPTNSFIGVFYAFTLVQWNAITFDPASQKAVSVGIACW
jgi:hypothetical protein